MTLKYEIVLKNPDGEVEKFSLLVAKRSGVRNLVLRLADADTVKVSAPFRASICEVEEFVKKHSEWIFAERGRFSKNRSLKDYLVANPVIWVAGNKMSASLHSTNAGAYWLEDFARGEIAFVFKDDADFKKLFLKYARDAIGRTLDFVAASRGLRVSKFSVRDQRSRWASRSSTGMLSFNWRMALLEPAYQEYIILHELAHEKFMDHSVSFWIYLSRLCENAKVIDKRLSKVAAEIFMLER